MMKSFSIFQLADGAELSAIDISKARKASEVDEMLGHRNWYGLAAESPEAAIEAFRRQKAEQSLTQPTTNRTTGLTSS